MSKLTELRKFERQIGWLIELEWYASIVIIFGVISTLVDNNSCGVLICVLCYIVVVWAMSITRRLHRKIRKKIVYETST